MYEPMLIALMRHNPTGTVEHHMDNGGKTGTTTQGFLAEFDEYIAAVKRGETTTKEF